MAETEAERERIGRLLHDDIGQVLSGVGLQLEALRMDLKDRPELAASALEIQNLLEQAMSHVRDLSTTLNPSVVERAGLQFALERLSERYRCEVGRPVRIHFQPGLHLPRAIAKAFYRVAEYAFQYAVLRAKCTQIEVLVKESKEAAVLEVRFDGEDAGMPSGANQTERVELLKLRHHARKAGISVNVEFSSKKGTIVRTRYLQSSVTV